MHLKAFEHLLFRNVWTLDGRIMCKEGNKFIVYYDRFQTPGKKYIIFEGKFSLW